MTGNAELTDPKSNGRRTSPRDKTGIHAAAGIGFEKVSLASAEPKHLRSVRATTSQLGESSIDGAALGGYELSGGYRLQEGAGFRRVRASARTLASLNNRGFSP